MTDKKYNFLFICTGNSARSIFAKPILLKETGEYFQTYSAGSKPFSELNPFASAVLEQKGNGISGLQSKNISEFQGQDAIEHDFVFTVCDQAANKECAPRSGQAISAHWGMPDPVKAQRANAGKNLACQQAYSALRNRTTAFASLTIASLDRISLQKSVDQIGSTVRERAL